MTVATTQEAQFDIVLLTHGRLELSIRCVRYLFEHTASPFHLIVMDDSTPDMDEGTDLTPEWFARFAKSHPNVTLVHSDIRYPTSIALLKQALQYCQTPYVGQIVNSVIVEPDWDMAALKLLQTIRDAGIVGFKALRQGTNLIESAGMGTQDDGNTIVDLNRSQAGNRYVMVYECDAIQGALWLGKKDCYEAACNRNLASYHGFKGCEDIEICFSAREQGWKVFYCGAGSYYHEPFSTRKAKSDVELLQNYQNKEIFAKRWGKWSECLKLNPLTKELLPQLKERNHRLPPVLWANSNGEIIKAATMKLDIREGVSDAEVAALKDLLSRVSSRGMVVADVGCWKGHSSSVLANHVKDYKGHVFAVDHWQGNEGTWNKDVVRTTDVFEVFKANMKALGLWGFITVFKMGSEEACGKIEDGALSLVFLDADHRYEPVKQDILNWWPKVKVGGIICGHDCETKYSELSEEDRVRVEQSKDSDYVDGRHNGVVKALYDVFGDDYESIPRTTLWVKTRRE